MGNSKIAYCHKVWNVVTGCSKVSAGCEHCFAEVMSCRPIHARLFGGDFSPRFHSDRIDEPTTWKSPQRVCVGFMGDMFHNEILDYHRTGIDAVIRKMTSWKAYQLHKYLLLTKRPSNMVKWAMNYPYLLGTRSLENVWFGVSVENQKAVDERLPLLEYMKFENIHTNLWLSIEPMLGPVDISAYVDKLDWVVLGGESGAGARSMKDNWAREVRDCCAAAGVPFFFKQYSSYHNRDYKTAELDGKKWQQYPSELLVPRDG